VCVCARAQRLLALRRARQRAEAELEFGVYVPRSPGGRGTSPPPDQFSSAASVGNGSAGMSPPQGALSWGTSEDDEAASDGEAGPSGAAAGRNSPRGVPAMRSLGRELQALGAVAEAGLSVCIE
jgi:hypothetical protein